MGRARSFAGTRGAPTALGRAKDVARAWNAVRAVARLATAETDLAEIVRQTLTIACDLAGGTGAVGRTDPVAGLTMTAAWPAPTVSPAMAAALADAAAAARPQPFQNGAGLAVPLPGGGRPLGALAVENATGRALPSVVAEALETIGRQLGLAIGAARLAAQAEVDVQNAAKLLAASRQLSSSWSLGRSLHQIAEHAMEATGAVACHVTLIDEGGRVQAHVQVGDNRLLGDLIIRPDGLSVRTLHEGRPLVIGNLRETAEPLNPQLRAAPWGASICLPMRSQTGPLGVIWLHYGAPRSFGATEIQLLSTFTNQAAIAIENTRLVERTHRLAVELRVSFHRLGHALTASGDPAHVLPMIAELAAHMVDAQAATIALVDEASGQLLQQASSGSARAELEALHRRLEDGLPMDAVRSGAVVQIPDLLADDRTHVLVAAGSLRAYLAAPLLLRGRAIGAIAVGRRQAGAFTEAETQLLSSFASQAAMAIANALLFREVSHERERLKAIFDNASDGILIVDQDRRVVAINHAMERLTGWQAGEALGRFCGEVCQSSDGDGISLCGPSCPLLRLFDGGGQIPYLETMFRARDGTERDVAVSYAGITSPVDGRLYGVSIVRDISKAKQIERMKSQFISTVSHELRTPLASIKASVGVLLASMPADTAEPIMRLLRNIERSNQRLEAIVSDLLDLTRLQSGRVQLHQRQVDLVEIAQAAVATMRPLTDQKGQVISLDSGSPALAMGDRTRLEQVLLNLLSNAHKYSPAGSEITVIVQDQVDAVAVGVRDRGPGIPPEEQALIFERFYRMNSGETQRAVGSGLGLAIARALVDLHGGAIWVESAVGQGSTFWFTTPKEGNE
ncbi:MAG: GAF domain-containing protein [Chloroflexi bacterium]|nr:GAF domain-containing protein [Chloroflexota bacterium]